MLENYVQKALIKMSKYKNDIVITLASVVFSMVTLAMQSDLVWTFFFSKLCR